MDFIRNFLPSTSEIKMVSLIVLFLLSATKKKRERKVKTTIFK